jgi:hypothetical protein
MSLMIWNRATGLISTSARGADFGGALAIEETF